MTTQELVERLRHLEADAKDLRTAADRLLEADQMDAENKRLREALERVLLDVEFLWEDGTLPNRRDDVIYVRARAALEHQP